MPVAGGDRAEVVVLLDSPPLARRARLGRQDRRRAAGVPERARRARSPAQQIGWRYRLVANGFSLALPSSEIERLRALPGVRDVLPAGSYAPQLTALAAADRRSGSLGPGARHGRAGREDRDHRLRYRPRRIRSSTRPATSCPPASREGSSASRRRRSSWRACSRRRAQPRRARVSRTPTTTRATARTSPASPPGTPTRTPTDGASRAWLRVRTSATTRSSSRRTRG